MKEVWKEIHGHEGYYEVSNMGRVRSLDRIVNYKISSGKASMRMVAGKILRQEEKKPYGYKKVRLYQSGKPTTLYTHCLVIDAFYPVIRKGSFLKVDHKDNNPLNNRLDNLQLLSHRENIVKSTKLKQTSSSWVGVWGAKGRWISSIRICGKTIRLGVFTDECKASEAYEAALSEYRKTRTLSKQPNINSISFSMPNNTKPASQLKAVFNGENYHV